MTVDTEVKQSDQLVDKKTDEVVDTAEHPDTVVATTDFDGGQHSAEGGDDIAQEASMQGVDVTDENGGAGDDNVPQCEGKVPIIDDNGVEYICIDDDDDPEVVKVC